MFSVRERDRVRVLLVIMIVLSQFSVSTAAAFEKKAVESNSEVFLVMVVQLCGWKGNRVR